MKNPPTKGCLRSFRKLTALFTQLSQAPGDDAVMHCIMGCEISAVCGDWANLFIGLAKEVADRVTAGATPEWRDVDNTFKGADCVTDAAGCACCCQNLKLAGQLK